MAEAEHHELIIVRRHEEEEHEAHSSAWKVAHADFMTAMMAFFLIMWLINVTDDQVRKGISEYFNPIHLSQGQTELKGLNQPDASGKQGGKKGHSNAAAEMPAFNPVQLSEGHSDAKALDTKAAAAAAAGAAAPGAGAGPAQAAAAPAKATGATAIPIKEPPGGSGDEKERAAFQDPYAVLSELAAKYGAEHPGSAHSIAGDDRKVGVAGGEVDRDPFDPVYWQLADVPSARTDNPGKPGTAAEVSHDVVPDAAAVLTRPGRASRAFDDGVVLEKLDGTPISLPDTALKKAAPGPASPKDQPAAKPEEKGALAGDGVGGTPAAKPKLDATESEAKTATGTEEEKNGSDTAERERVAATPEESAAVTARDLAGEARTLGDQIAKSLSATLASGASPLLAVKATSEGILIDLTDDVDFSMFEVGSAIPNAKVVVLMTGIAKALADRPGKIVVRGYTDGRPFRSALYDNWRLSAARAQMAHYMLTRSSLDDSRFVRIEGYADRVLKNPGDPFAAENRRIEILLQEDKS